MCHRESIKIQGIFRKEAILKLFKNLFGDSLGGQAAFAAVEGVFGTMEDAAKEAQKEREDEIKRIHGPIGLAIGAKSPQEIAISIISEIITIRNKLEFQE